MNSALIDKNPNDQFYNGNYLNPFEWFQRQLHYVKSDISAQGPNRGLRNAQFSDPFPVVDIQ